MKKFLIPIIVIPLVLVALVALWGPKAQSQSNLPYPDKPLQNEAGLTACKKSVANEVFLMRTAWDKNLKTMLDQQKPASEMVDEAFEGMRTYRCWLNYLCSAVLYSSNANPKDTLNDPNNSSSGYRPLTTGEIDSIPGCANPNDVRIPDTSIHYVPECAIDTKTQSVPEGAQKNFADCQEIIEREFSDPTRAEPGKDVETFMNQSPAFIVMERELKRRSGEQSTGALADKLRSILTKMNAMEGHMSSLKTLTESLYNRIPCFCSKCD